MIGRSPRAWHQPWLFLADARGSKPMRMNRAAAAVGLPGLHNPRFARACYGGMMSELAATARQMGATNAITTFDSDDGGGGSIRGDSGKQPGNCDPNLQVQRYTHLQWILHGVDLWPRPGNVCLHLQVNPQRQGMPQIPNARLRLRRV
jgi:hypothetical protein